MFALPALPELEGERVRYNLPHHTTMLCRVRFTSSVFLKSNRCSGLIKDQKQTRTLASGLCRLATAGRRVGGAERDRTDDLLLAKQALSQLSYSPICIVMLRCSGSRARLLHVDPSRLA